MYIKRNATKYGQPTSFTHKHLLRDGEFVPGISLQEFKIRRQLLVQKILETSGSKRHLVILPSSRKKYISGKIPYVFRQNSDFMYLTGNKEPDSCLVLEIAEDGNVKTTMFLQPKSAHQELWDGPVTGLVDGPAFFAVDQAIDINDLPKYINLVYTSLKPSVLWYNKDESELISLSVVVEELSKNQNVQNPTNLIHKFRVIKSPTEQNLMRKSCEIASAAINSTVQFSKPNMSEHHLFAKVDYECRVRGAEMLAYPPVVAAGTNATIIHYINNSQIINWGEMVLMDAGCETHSYTSDITRTFPISGRFSDYQKTLYEIVLNTQKDLIGTLSRQELSLDQLFDVMCLQLGKYLKEIKLIPSHVTGLELARSAYKFCPHHVSHFLGMDVHDTPSISRAIKLLPGMVFTIEPGIYISSGRRDVPEEFRGIGIRVEDDVLLNENGTLEILTASCLKEINDIER